MKFYILLFIGVFSTTLSLGQITVGTNTLIDAGDILKYHSLLSTDANYQENAPDTEWNFSDLTDGVQSNDTILPASSGANFAAFPSATSRFSFLGMEAYSILTNDQVEILGMAGQELVPDIMTPLIFSFTDPLIFQSRPLTIDDTYTQNTQFSTKLATADLPIIGPQIDTINIPMFGDVTIDSLELIGHLNRESTIVSYGTALIEELAIDVLKEHSVDSLSFTIMARGTYMVGNFPITLWLDVTNFIPEEVLAISRREIITDRFIGEDYKESIVEITQDSQFENALTIRFKSALLLSSVEDHVFKKSLLAYPNPSSGLIYLDHNDRGHLIVRDISGNILTQFNYLGEPINLTNYPSGLYIIELISDKNREFVKVEKID